MTKESTVALPPKFSLGVGLATRLRQKLVEFLAGRDCVLLNVKGFSGETYVDVTEARRIHIKDSGNLTLVADRETVDAIAIAVSENRPKS